MADPVAVEPAAGVRFGVLGPLQVVDDSGAVRAVPAGKQRIVLAALLLAGGGTVSAASLAEALWDASPPPNAPAVMRTYVARLRHSLGPAGARIVGQPPGWAVELHAREEFDVAEADGLWRAARAAAGAGEWLQASLLLSRALGLWRGEPLVDVPSAVLARREVDRLAELRLQLTEARIDADLCLGRHSQLVAELRRLVAEHPLREHIWAQLMLACYRCEQRGAALEVYRNARATLAEELGVEPGDELRQMHQQVLAADPQLTVTARAVSAVDAVASHDRQTPPGYRHGLPPDTAVLAGRDAEVSVLTAGQTGANAVRVVSGMPGVGKTALAVHAAHLLAPSFPDRQMFIDLHGHTPGRNPVSPVAALADLITATGVDARFLPADLAGRSAMWRDRLTGQRALLVLDNAASGAQIAPLLPGGGGCLVVVTSRRQIADLPGAVVRVRLAALSRASARAMFVTLTPRAGSEDRALVDELTALAGYLPLAISLLARVHACHPAWTLSDLITETRDSVLAMTAERASVSTALGISWRHLRPGQRRLLALLSLHPGTTSEAHAAAALAGVPVCEAAWQLDRLHHECLLAEISYRRYRMHDLIQSYASAQARAMFGDGEAAAALRRLVSYYARAATDDNLGWQRAERGNLIGCLEYAAAAGWSSEVVTLTTAIAGLLRRDGPWPQAELLHAAAVEAARGLPDRAVLARCLLDLATVRRLNSDHQRASEDLAAALELYRALGDQAGEAAALVELSYVRTFANDWEAASTSAGQALDICRAIGDRPGQARALTVAGNIRRHTADFPGARGALTEAVAICRELGDAAGLAFALRQLGDVSRAASEFAAAKAYLSESVELARAADDRRAEAIGLAWLGNVRWRTGDPAAARDLERALNLQRDLGNRAGQANALTLLGNIRHAAGDHTVAISDLKQALRLHRDASSSAGEAATLALLGSALAATGDYEAAVTDLRTAISIFRDLSDRYGEAESLILLAELHFTWPDITKARLLYQQALNLARRVASPWDEARALAGLGRCARADGDIQHAISMLTQAYQIFHRIGAAEAANVAAERDAIAGQAVPQEHG
jgi:DNA-binding SARP family transcriptional activator/tetratricopeptide (TPR) repeat protein